MLTVVLDFQSNLSRFNLVMNTEQENTHTEASFEVAMGEVEVGRVYPVFGAITKFLDETPGNVIVELNFNIKMHMNITEASKVEILKERAFESGIFVAKAVSTEPMVEMLCHTVIFGRKQAHMV